MEKINDYSSLMGLLGGGGGIRTPGALAGTTVFKTAAIDHSATPPWGAAHCHISLLPQGNRLRAAFGHSGASYSA
jgi:hypothetical protein